MVQGLIMGVVSLRFQYGGKFKKSINGIEYVDGSTETYRLDVDLICYFDLIEMAKGYVNGDAGLFYLKTGAEFKDGLSRVNGDAEINEICEIFACGRILDLYILDVASLGGLHTLRSEELQSESAAAHTPNLTDDSTNSHLTKTENPLISSFFNSEIRILQGTLAEREED